MELNTWFYFSIRNLNVKMPNKCFPWCSHHSSLNCLSRAILILYFHSVCINEVAQGKRKQINQKQSHYTILKSFFRTQFNYDANRLPSS